MQFDASSRGYEAVSAHLAAAVALCQLARYDDAEEEIRVAVSQRRRPGLAEALATAAEIELWYGDPVRARDYLDEYERNEVGHSHRQLFLMARLWLALFTDDSSRIGAWTVELGDDPGGHANTGGRFSVALTKTRVRTRLGVVTADDFKALRAIADAQDSPLEHELVDMASAIWQGPASLSDVLERQKSGLSLSILADDVSRLIAQISEGAQLAVIADARERAWRWRPLLRRRVESGGDGVIHAARCLAEIGTRADVEALRRLARVNRRLASASALSRNLAQRLAPRIRVRDMGRIRINVGDDAVNAENVRRKVLALLAFLITQPRFSATRDQVTEVLWPDLAPDLALNSLNQTILFSKASV